MILCVDAGELIQSGSVQRDVDVPDLLTRHVGYFKSAEEAAESHYAPLDFCTMIRTTYSNRVARIRVARGAWRYYVNLSRVDTLPHRGDDLAAYMAATAVEHLVDYSERFAELMAEYSALRLVGVLNPDAGRFNPLVLMHVVIADEAAGEFEGFLRKEVSLVTFQCMRDHAGGNVPALLDTMEEVAEDEQGRVPPRAQGRDGADAV